MSIIYLYVCYRSTIRISGQKDYCYDSYEGLSLWKAISGGHFQDRHMAFAQSHLNHLIHGLSWWWGQETPGEPWLRACLRAWTTTNCKWANLWDHGLLTKQLQLLDPLIQATPESSQALPEYLQSHESVLSVSWAGQRSSSTIIQGLGHHFILLEASNTKIGNCVCVCRPWKSQDMFQVEQSRWDVTNSEAQAWCQC